VQKKTDVSIIYAADNSEVTLNYVSSFGSENVTLVADINTSYTLDHGVYILIINLTSSKSFNITNGLLKCGASHISSLLYFIHVNDNSYFTMYLMEVMFSGKMNSIIYIKGGTVCVEGCKIINQKWIKPLIDVYAIMSPVIVNFILNNISKCDYICVGELQYKSGVIYMSNESKEDLKVNISCCSFLENSLNLLYNDSGLGGIGCFYGFSFGSSMLNKFYI
jgi:hypothetical protein